MTAADISALFIMLREGLEAALIVGIVMAYLANVGALRYQRYVWSGVGAAAALSLLALYVLGALGKEFTGATEEVFEGVTMLLAASFLTWMIFWMLRQARYLKGELQRGVDRALAEGAVWGLFLLVFFAVLREGVESALFLQSAIFAAQGQSAAFGALVGLAIAVGIGVAIYVFGKSIDLRTFFWLTGIALILFAAGLVAHAAHEFAEAGLLAAIEGPKLWSTKAFLPDNSGLGAILRAVLGYQDEPTVLELVAYVGYFAAVWALWKTGIAGRFTPRAVEARTA